MAKTNSHKEKVNVIDSKFYGKLPVENVWSYFYLQKNGIAEKLIYHLKYANMPQLGIELGLKYGKELLISGKIMNYDFIVPVPLHYKKLKIRGYNQSTKFSEGLSESLNIPVVEALNRKVATETQTSKSRLARWKNVNSIFEISNDSINGKSILLVDDVVTTGATLEACGNVLIDKGCRLSIITLASAK